MKEQQKNKLHIYIPSEHASCSEGCTLESIKKEKHECCYFCPHFKKQTCSINNLFSCPIAQVLASNDQKKIIRLVSEYIKDHTIFRNKILFQCDLLNNIKNNKKNTGFCIALLV